MFAAQGYLGATMNAIAEQAELGTPSSYPYLPSKAELFEAAIAADLAGQFERLLEQRVLALAVVVLLDRAQGSSYEHYGERFVALLLESTLAQIRGASRNVPITLLPNP